MAIREPAVAGMFYQAGADALREQIEACFLDGPGSLPKVNPHGSRRIIGLVSPHAGFIYSGSIAAWGYHRLADDGLPDVAVIIGPNHRSYFPAAALSEDKAWRTPLGDVKADAGIAQKIASAYPAAEVHPGTHRAEHSLEVQLPFLQYLARGTKKNMRIVPVLIGVAARSASEKDDAEVAGELGNAIADAIGDEKAIVIASTDFTHYESAESAAGKDSRAINRILALDEAGLLDIVRVLDISMCGDLSTAVAIAACKKLGATSAEQLAYANSGDVTGDYDEVVGYASLTIFR
jgi:hypothetical protein